MLRKEKQKMGRKYFITKIKLQTKYAWDSGQQKKTKSGRGSGAPGIFGRGGGADGHMGLQGAATCLGARGQSQMGASRTEEQPGNSCTGVGGGLYLSDFCAPRPHPRKSRLDCIWCTAPLRQRCDAQAHPSIPHMSPQLS